MVRVSAWRSVPYQAESAHHTTKSLQEQFVKACKKAKPSASVHKKHAKTEPGGLLESAAPGVLSSILAFQHQHNKPGTFTPQGFSSQVVVLNCWKTKNLQNKILDPKGHILWGGYG